MEYSRLSSRSLEKELTARGLLPDGCRLIEFSMTPNSALMLRYEVFIRSDQLGEFADALKAVADVEIAHDEQRQQGNESNGLRRGQTILEGISDGSQSTTAREERPDQD